MLHLAFRIASDVCRKRNRVCSPHPLATGLAQLMNSRLILHMSTTVAAEGCWEKKLFMHCMTKGIWQVGAAVIVPICAVTISNKIIIPVRFIVSQIRKLKTLSQNFFYVNDTIVCNNEF